MPPGTTKARELPSKRCFDLWLELKSNTKVANRLAAEGVVNDKGYPYHYTSVTNACYRYMMENMEEARKALLDYKYEWAADDTTWLDYVVRKAWTRWMTDPIRFVEWMDKHNLDINFYSYIYEEHLLGLQRYIDQHNARKAR